MSKHDHSVKTRLRELKHSRAERRYVGGGSAAAQYALREYNRAVRRQGKALCTSYAPEPWLEALMGKLGNGILASDSEGFSEED